MTFSASIDAIPTQATAGLGSGLTISLLKALTHLSVIRATDDNEYLAMPDEVRAAELTAIADHLSNDRLLSPPAGSTTLNNLLTTLRQAGADLRAEFPNWDQQQTRDNLALLADRIVAICRIIDYELGGLVAPDQGDQL